MQSGTVGKRGHMNGQLAEGGCWYCTIEKVMLATDNALSKSFPGPMREEKRLLQERGKKVEAVYYILLLQSRAGRAL